MAGDLNGRRAIVCGGSQGIGWAAACEMAERGASVTLFARNPESLAQAVSRLPRAASQEHDFLVADFGAIDQVRQAIEAWTSRGRPCSILLNNTGGPPAGPVLAAPASEFLAAFQHHLLVNQTLVQALLPGMREQGFGRIINVISTSVKQPIPGLGVSNTIRGAVANWSKTLAGEVAAWGITVNNVLPGATRTSRLESLISAGAAKRNVPREVVEQEWLAHIPAGRFAEPREIAAAIAFLASPAAGYITGINLPVDGGRTQCL